MNRRERRLHGLILCLMRPDDLCAQPFYLTPHARHFKQQFLQRKLFAFFNAFPEAKNRRERESKAHELLAPVRLPSAGRPASIAEQ
ncbi:MAG TPA: hypothetical protein VFB43_08405 [Terracidiphilus sp.]|nr:hypothetical protein [Terracidiphilus sp.]